MEGEAESSAALGLSPQIFINEVLNIVEDLRCDAFEQGAPEAVGTATATQKADDLELGVNYIHNVVRAGLDKRMSRWETYCLRQCLTVPEGFVAPEDDNSSAMVLYKDGNNDSELDAELNLLRKKLEDANKESEELQREISSLERQTTHKSTLNSSMAEVLKLFVDKSVQDNIQALVNTIPKLHQKMKVMKRKKVEVESMVDQNVWKRLALGSVASTEDIREVNEVVNGSRKE
ncbi:unnamed protein product [Alopecurus aequalis]